VRIDSYWLFSRLVILCALYCTWLGLWESHLLDWVNWHMLQCGHWMFDIWSQLTFSSSVGQVFQLGQVNIEDSLRICSSMSLYTVLQGCVGMNQGDYG
jgi:hypothetical protein